MKAKKSLGQNFLKDTSIVREIIETAALKPTDTVLEIGPGTGALTGELLKKAAKVIAIEFDAELIPLLQKKFVSSPNFTLIHQDALRYAPPAQPYKLVANFPYYITSPLLNHYLLGQFQNGHPPQEMTIMVQKEVAEKILAEDGKHSVLSLQVHLFGDPEWVCEVPRTAFDPVPKVDSAVIHIKVHAAPKIEGELKQIIWLFHVSFAQKRKKLSNNLAAVLKKDPSEIRALLSALKINPDIRAEALTLDEWSKLLRALDSIPHSS